MKEMLDVKAAAAYLGLSPQTLNKLRSVGGSPPYFKALSRVLYDRAELDVWLDARRRHQVTETPRAGGVHAGRWHGTA